MLRLAASRSVRFARPQRLGLLQAQRGLTTKFSKVSRRISARAARMHCSSRRQECPLCGAPAAWPLLSWRPPLLCRRAQDHEWIKVEGDIGTIGITNHAQDALGDVVFVDLPDVGLEVEQNETMGAVESVKAASDIYSPVSGEVTEVNEALNDDPSLVNSAAEGDGWMSKVKLSNPSELDGLMDEAAYTAFCAEN